MLTMTREAWTDERLDDLAHRVDTGFREVHEDMRELRRDMKAGFERVDAKFEKLDAKFDAKFDSLQRLMLAAMVTFILSFVLTQI